MATERNDGAKLKPGKEMGHFLEIVDELPVEQKIKATLNAFRNGLLTTLAEVDQEDKDN